MDSFSRKLLKVKTFLEIRRMVTPKKRRETAAERGKRLSDIGIAHDIAADKGTAPKIDIKRDKPF